MTGTCHSPCLENLALCGRHPIGAMSPGVQAWLVAVDTGVSTADVNNMCQLHVSMTPAGGLLAPMGVASGGPSVLTI